MSKDKALGLQRSPRSEYSDLGAPDQPAKIRGRGQLFWVCGSDKGREYTPQSEVTHEGRRPKGMRAAKHAPGAGVFVSVIDPSVVMFEPEIGGKWLELLKEIAPGLNGCRKPLFQRSIMN
jgi:hypothetical protein